MLVLLLPGLLQERRCQGTTGVCVCVCGGGGGVRPQGLRTSGCCGIYGVLAFPELMLKMRLKLHLMYIPGGNVIYPE